MMPPLRVPLRRTSLGTCDCSATFWRVRMRAVGPFLCCAECTAPTVSSASAGRITSRLGKGAEGRNRLNRLVSGAVLADTDIVSEDVGGGKLGKRGDTDRGPHVVNEHKEGGTGRAEETVEGDTVHERSHGVLTDTEVEVLAGISLVEALAEVAAVLDVVLVGAVEIGRAREELGHEVGDVVDDSGARLTGGNTLARGDLWDLCEHLLSGV
eukprot:30064_3